MVVDSQRRGVEGPVAERSGLYGLPHGFLSDVEPGPGENGGEVAISPHDVLTMCGKMRTNETQRGIVKLYPDGHSAFISHHSHHAHPRGIGLHVADPRLMFGPDEDADEHSHQKFLFDQGVAPFVSGRSRTVVERVLDGRRPVRRHLLALGIRGDVDGVEIHDLLKAADDHVRGPFVIGSPVFVTEPRAQQIVRDSLKFFRSHVPRA
mmetsp:Transcript_40898/g.95975  ORF Transcript_40898/g.95975 Transcript_40898/m.95975 type:complete len:207 (+) Transcript_40898:1556-2176(+)